MSCVGAERGGDALHRDAGFRKRPFAEIAARDRDAQALGAARERGRRGLDRTVGADRILGIRPLHGVVGEREVARRARERSEMIEARDERIGARAREPPIGRLQAEQPAERGRHADRAIGVGAERERHQPARDRAARAARRAAGHAAEIVRIVRVAVMHVLAGEVVGVFAHVERADQHGAGGLEPLDQRRVVRRGRKLAVDLRAGACRQALHVEQVLHRERHAGERSQRLLRGARRVDRLRALAGALRRARR